MDVTSKTLRKINKNKVIRTKSLSLRFVRSSGDSPWRKKSLWGTKRRTNFFQKRDQKGTKDLKKVTSSKTYVNIFSSKFMNVIDYGEVYMSLIGPEINKIENINGPPTSNIAEWQNNCLPEFLPSATREPPKTWSAANAPNYEDPPRYKFWFLAPSNSGDFYV